MFIGFLPQIIVTPGGRPCTERDTLSLGPVIVAIVEVWVPGAVLPELADRIIATRAKSAVMDPGADIVTVEFARFAFEKEILVVLAVHFTNKKGLVPLALTAIGVAAANQPLPVG
jgi:hypothetical protein